jgi:copper transport protein
VNARLPGHVLLRRVPLSVPLLGLVLVCAGLAVLAPGAWAHSAFEGAEPPAGSLLTKPPSEIVLFFSQGIDPAFSTAGLLDPDGSEIAGTASRVETQPHRLVVDLPQLTQQGRYQLPWRVRSTGDGHVYEGELSFILAADPDAEEATGKDVGSPEADRAEAGDGGAEPTGEAAAAEEPSFPVVLAAQAVMRPDLPEWAAARPPAGESLLRWLGLTLAALVAGPYLFVWLVRPDSFGAEKPNGEAFPVPLRLLAGGAAAGLAVVTVVFLVQQAAIAGAASGPAALGRPLLSLLATSTGLWWASRAVLAVILAVLAVRAAPGSRPTLGLLLAALLLLTFSATSHAAGHSAALLLPADWLHMAALAAWAGGIASLALLLLTRGRTLDLHGLLARFSAVALVSVVLLTATGLVAAAAQVRYPAVMSETAYGRALLAKLAVFAALLGLGAINRFVLIARIRSGSRATGGRLQFVLGAELAGIALLLAAVGVMTSGVPTREAEEGRRSLPLAQSFATQDLRATLEVTDGSRPPQILVLLEDLNLGSGAALEDGGSPDNAVLAVVRDAAGAELRTVNLPTWDGRRFAAQGDFFPPGETWSLELVVKRPGHADVVQPLAMPPLF